MWKIRLGFSACHRRAAVPICRRLLAHLTVFACCLALLRLGSRIAISSAMMPMTTRSSTSVNARVRRDGRWTLNMVCGLRLEISGLLRLLFLFADVCLVAGLAGLELGADLGDRGGVPLRGVVVAEHEPALDLDGTDRVLADRRIVILQHAEQRPERLVLLHLGQSGD